MYALAVKTLYTYELPRFNPTRGAEMRRVFLRFCLSDYTMVVLAVSFCWQTEQHSLPVSVAVSILATAEPWARPETLATNYFICREACSPTFVCQMGTPRGHRRI